MSAEMSRSRREFLATAATGAAAAGLAGLPGRLDADTAPKRTAVQTGEAVTRTLGRTGFELPIVSMGVMNTDDANLIRRSREMGVRFFDTAASYMGGRNEEVVGATLREMGVRDETVIATKILHSRTRRGMTPDQIAAAFIEHSDQSLERLGTDHVEILYMHAIQDPADISNAGFQEGMARIKEQGKARFTGFSTHRNMAACIRAAVEAGGVDVILSSFNFAFEGQADLAAAMQEAAAAGIGIVAMKTQCVRDLARRNVPAEGRTTYPTEVMHKAVLKWALGHEFIGTAIPGYTTYEQLEQNFSVALDPALTEQEQQFLDDNRIRNELGFCLQCEQCLATCPGQADIPSLMRVHMYAAAYTNFEQARETLTEIEPGRGIESCAACRSCTARCANTVNIAERIAELQTIYA